MIKVRLTEDYLGVRIQGGKEDFKELHEAFLYVIEKGSHFQMEAHILEFLDNLKEQEHSFIYPLPALLLDFLISRYYINQKFELVEQEIEGRVFVIKSFFAKVFEAILTSLGEKKRHYLLRLIWEFSLDVDNFDIKRYQEVQDCYTKYTIEERKEKCLEMMEDILCASK